MNRVSYVSSVVLCFVAIWTITWIYGDQILENGWGSDGKYIEYTEETSNFDIVLYTLVVSCVPVVRFLYMVLILIMATFTKEAVEDWLANVLDYWC